jgi:hypothetical protein
MYNNTLNINSYNAHAFLPSANERNSFSVKVDTIGVENTRFSIERDIHMVTPDGDVLASTHTFFFGNSTGGTANAGIY